MPNQRHSSRALPAQHDASLSSPKEPVSIHLKVLAIDLCNSGGEKPLALFPEVRGARSTDPTWAHMAQARASPPPAPRKCPGSPIAGGRCWAGAALGVLGRWELCLVA